MGQATSTERTEQRAFELLRAIVAAADKHPGGDTPLQEIPKDLICDARALLAEVVA